MSILTRRVDATSDIELAFDTFEEEILSREFGSSERAFSLMRIYACPSDTSSNSSSDLSWVIQQAVLPTKKAADDLIYLFVIF